MPDDRNTEIALFEAAAQLPPSEREIFLAKHCADDPRFRQRLEALLRSNDRVGNFLEDSPTSSIIEGRAEVTPGEKPGDRIGRYKLLQQIGEGGCGVVFMAEQEGPIRR